MDRLPQLYKLLLLALMSLLMGSSIISAQSGKQAPLIIEINGDLFAWDGTDTKQLTNWGYNSMPILSPNGKYVAYKSLPRFVVDDIKKNGMRSGYPPSNFWVMDIATGNAFRIADQPPDAHYADNGVEENFISRPIPAWSPASKALAWGEIVGFKVDANGDWGGYDQHLVIYDLAGKKLRTIVQNMPARDGISEGDDVSWGASGLTYLTYQDNLPLLYIYDLDGKQVAKYPIKTKPIPVSASWIKDNDKDYILIKSYTLADSFLIDPEDGKQLPLIGKLELYSTTAPDGIRLFYDNGWVINDPDMGTMAIGEATQMAISPDGNQVVYTTEDEDVMYYHNGDAIPFLVKGDMRLGDFVWTPTVLHIRHENTGN